MDEPWCLVASEATAPTRVLIRYYGKRRGIEAGFRDIKDMRFGMGLSSMHVSRPDRRDRLLLISALAIAVLSLLGAAGERIGYDRWLKANTVKRRTHSLFRQGLMLYHHLPNWSEDRIRPLMETFGSMLMEPTAAVRHRRRQCTAQRHRPRVRHVLPAGRIDAHRRQQVVVPEHDPVEVDHQYVQLAQVPFGQLLLEHASPPRWFIRVFFRRLLARGCLLRFVGRRSFWRIRVIAT